MQQIALLDDIFNDVQGQI